MPVPVISVAQMREWERATWAAGQTEAAVIAQVGQIVARRVLDLTRDNDLVLLLAGKGHNGDDARAAHPCLPGRRVTLLDIIDPAAAHSKVAEALRSRPALVVDGLFGIGLDRPLGEEWQKLIGLVNDSGARILAVDVPSGLDAESGEPRGAAIRADITLTVGAPKTGFLRSRATGFVGRLEVAPDIGLVTCPFSSEINWVLREDFSDFPPRRKPESHKGSYGHAGILAGSLGYHGAAVLTTRGAQRARPGLITVFTEDRVYSPVAAQLQAVM
ncbi:MAG TPA: NAD(P)H-hydrate epimerase, partial [Verrucomicrobiae bacterium]|nr:NAD(P)H-hydrate epimerase [Verrucomicrobiae bacterium]